MQNTAWYCGYHDGYNNRIVNTNGFLEEFDRYMEGYRCGIRAQQPSLQSRYEEGDRLREMN